MTHERRYRSVIELQCVWEVVSVIDPEMYILQPKTLFKSWQRNLKFFALPFGMYIQGLFSSSLGTA
jgi:hypothetical protein